MSDAQRLAFDGLLQQVSLEVLMSKVTVSPEVLGFVLSVHNSVYGLSACAMLAAPEAHWQTSISPQVCAPPRHLDPQTIFSTHQAQRFLVSQLASPE